MVLDTIITYIVRFYKTIDCILGLNEVSYRYAVLNSFLVLVPLISSMVILSSKDENVVRAKIVDSETMYCKVAFIMFSVVLGLSLAGLHSFIIVFGTDVGEHSFDTLHIYRHGHWSTSFKNPYYDLVNVPALLRVFLCIVLGIHSLSSVTSACIISFFVNLCFIIALYEFTKKVLNKRSPLLFLLTYTIAISNPYVYRLLTSSHYMGYSFLLSMLSLMVIFFHSNTYKFMILSCLLYYGSLLTHGTALLFMLPLILYTIYNKRGGKERNISLCLRLYLSLIIVITMLRIIYTTAYRGFLPYLSEIVSFLIWGLEGEIKLREVKWSLPEVPRATAISFTFLPALALCPLIIKFFNSFMARFNASLRDRKKSDLGIINKPQYTEVFLVSAIVLNILSFLCSFFSTSLNRELGVPAMGFLIFPIICTVNVVWNKRVVSRLILLFLTILALTANWATPLTIPWYKDYTKITIAWRTAFYEYYLQSLSIVRLYDFMTPITIYAGDKVCLEYASMMLYNVSIPRNIIKVYDLQVFSRNNTNIVYNSISLLINIP